MWFADHFMPNAADTSGPKLECFTVLAALAVAVPRVRLGSLVAGNTYRNPAVLAKMAANIDIMSGGRLVLGLGAGWQENEHAAYEIPFYTLGGRLRRLEEACQVMTGLFSNPPDDARRQVLRAQGCAPRAQAGAGKAAAAHRRRRREGDDAHRRDVRRRMEHLGHPVTPEQKMGVLDQHCRDLGRDPKSLKRSAQAMVVLTDEPERLERMRGGGGFAVIGGTAKETQAASPGVRRCGPGRVHRPRLQPRPERRTKDRPDGRVNQRGVLRVQVGTQGR